MVASPVAEFTVQNCGVETVKEMLCSVLSEYEIAGIVVGLEE